MYVQRICSVVSVVACHAHEAQDETGEADSWSRAAAPVEPSWIAACQRGVDHDPPRNGLQTPSVRKSSRGWLPGLMSLVVAAAGSWPTSIMVRRITPPSQPSLHPDRPPSRRGDGGVVPAVGGETSQVGTASSDEAHVSQLPP
ncbi:hypothetical protein RJ55_03542 [Drechmeria coniospora]|nr:hypothetical protein RJ55_03542 [Drechmeria coniospora]